MIGHGQACICQALAAGALGQIQQQLFDELVEVVDLLEFAPGVLVELALAGQDVQLLQERDRLAGADRLAHFLV